MKARSRTSLRSPGAKPLTHNSNRIALYLQAIAFLNLPNWWLAGGAVRNTVWRSHQMLIR
ncbi:nucleotidyltransferase family protein [Microcoleus sp. FACHB-SPT15]|uniref:nucleotidyltransferase family protein n=1 Tax=Microcoleus sp. FACHB-SPT15 TaxID=2692830 RepID=UPI0028C3D09F|nr:nucleotidyltransferase family protein [Microcoleus sp. FACHB-SPT15]